MGLGWMVKAGQGGVTWEGGGSGVVRILVAGISWVGVFGGVVDGDGDGDG